MVLRQSPLDFFKTLLLSQNPSSPFDVMDQLTDLLKLDIQNAKKNTDDTVILGVVAVVAIIAVVAVIAIFYFTQSEKPVADQTDFRDQLIDRLDNIEKELEELRRHGW